MLKSKEGDNADENPEKSDSQSPTKSAKDRKSFNGKRSSPDKDKGSSTTKKKKKDKDRDHTDNKNKSQRYSGNMSNSQRSMSIESQKRLGMPMTSNSGSLNSSPLKRKRDDRDMMNAASGVSNADLRSMSFKRVNVDHGRE